MLHSKFTALTIFLLQIILPSGVLADKVVFDLHSDQPEKWLEITCLYNDDYHDFWVYGYPVQLTGDDDVYPSKKGFWTPGQSQRCEMHYYGGEKMPKAKTLKIGMYVQGTPEILVSSMSNPLGDEYTYEIGSIRPKEGWTEASIDLTDKRGYVFNFTMISIGEDILVVDKIEFDLGDDTTTPPVPPEPTTSRPIVDNILTLDSDKDYWMVWDVDCHYVSDFSYLWAFGCPVEPMEDDTENGFWAPCAASCSLSFYGNVSVMSRVPESIRIRSYVGDGGTIKITAQSNRDPTCDKGCSVVGVVEGTKDKWTEITIPLNVTFPASGYKINIELIPNEGGTVLVEKVKLVTAGGGTTTEGSSGSDNSACGLAESKWTLLSSILLITTLFHLKT